MLCVNVLCICVSTYIHHYISILPSFHSGRTGVEWDSPYHSGLIVGELDKPDHSGSLTGGEKPHHSGLIWGESEKKPYQSRLAGFSMLKPTAL